MSSEQYEPEEPVGCIVGAVVQLKPDVGNDVRQRLTACEGVDIHAEDGQSRLVITLEANTGREMMKLTEHIQNFDGVLYVTPVYQHSEENKNHEQGGGWEWR